MTADLINVQLKSVSILIVKLIEVLSMFWFIWAHFLVILFHLFNPLGRRIEKINYYRGVVVYDVMNVFI